MFRTNRKSCLSTLKQIGFTAIAGSLILKSFPSLSFAYTNNKGFV